MKQITITTAQERYQSWMSDTLIYTVILNLFDEYWDAITIESFTISILTAMVLKVLLDILAKAETQAHHYVGQYSKVLGILAMWAILFLGKLIILEVVDLIFGDEVELGHLLDVIVLVLTLMVGRELMRRLFLALGTDETDATFEDDISEV